MPVITKTSLTAAATDAVPITWTTLTASDTFTYTPGVGEVLLIDNTSAGAVTVTVDGDGVGSERIAGYGIMNLAAGWQSGAIAAGQSRAVQLDAIGQRLRGVIAVTGGAGARAAILTR